MTGPQEGSQKDQQIPPGHAQSPGQAQKVEPRHGQNRTQPGLGPGSLLPQQARQGHDDDIQPGDKSGFPGGGVNDPCLLQRRSCEQDQTGGQPPLENALRSGR